MNMFQDTKNVHFQLCIVRNDIEYSLSCGGRRYICGRYLNSNIGLMKN